VKNPVAQAEVNVGRQKGQLIYHLDKTIYAALAPIVGQLKCKIKHE
jgi:hypothetical protein